MFNLDEFFRVSQEKTLPNGEIVSIRTLSDIELRARDDYSLSHTATMTSKLRRTDTPEYETHILPLKDAPLDSLIDTLILSERQSVVRDALLAYPIKFFPYPEDPEPEEKVDAEVKQQEHEVALANNRLKYITEREEALRKKYSEQPRDMVVQTVLERAISVYATAAGDDASTWYTIHCAVETEPSVKKWKTPQEVSQLPKRVLDELVRAYQEVDSVDPWSLTKSESEGSAEGMDTEHREGESKVGGE